MSQCPLCAAEIKEDFGLIECPNCSAQLIVHMDGRVEYSGGAESADHEESEPPSEAESSDTEFFFAEQPQEFDVPVTEAKFIGGEDDQTVALPQDATFALPQEDEAQDLFADPEPAPEPAPRPVVIRPKPKPAEPKEPVIIPEGSADLSDIARFGNSDASSLRDGSLRYNLLISGIDTADVRDAFREAITDRKLVWDTEAILRSIRNGEVRIQNVTPPKAYIIVSRLRNLPVHVFWEQYAIAQS